MSIKVYTKGGDKGRTSLVGGARVAKSDPRLEAYGTLDELLAHLGYFYDLYLADNDQNEPMRDIIGRVMDCTAIIATPSDVAQSCTIDHAAIERIEALIDSLNEKLPAIKHFTLPIGCAPMSYANVCRTVCRRAERAVVRMASTDPTTTDVQIYINRLSDYLYVLGRSLAYQNLAKEILWR